VTDSLADNMQSLPQDTEALRALILATFAERDAAVTERDVLQAQNDRLRHLLLKLTRMQFGAMSERLPDDQLQLGLEALEQAIAKDEAEAEKQDPELRKDNAVKRRANRGALPAHLPRIEVILEPEDTACPCCRAPMTVIGEDTSERLDVIPAQFRVIVTKRPKLACRGCPGTVVQAPAPARLIEGGIPTEALVAHVAVSRYADHQPLYRLAQIMARQGVIIDRSTLSFWMGYAAAEVAPVVTRLREMMLTSTRISGITGSRRTRSVTCAGCTRRLLSTGKKSPGNWPRNAKHAGATARGAETRTPPALRVANRCFTASMRQAPAPSTSTTFRPVPRAWERCSMPSSKSTAA
jgi:transposase